jgi:hypothetical protein
MRHGFAGKPSSPSSLFHDTHGFSCMLRIEALLEAEGTLAYHFPTPPSQRPSFMNFIFLNSNLARVALLGTLTQSHKGSIPSTNQHLFISDNPACPRPSVGRSSRTSSMESFMNFIQPSPLLLRSYWRRGRHRVCGLELRTSSRLMNTLMSQPTCELACSFCRSMKSQMHSFLLSISIPSPMTSLKLISSHQSNLIPFCKGS